MQRSKQANEFPYNIQVGFKSCFST